MCIRDSVNGVYTNIASVGSTTLDVNAANNSANVAIGVPSIPNADLGISLDASPDSAPVSSNFSFTITVTNRGPASAANVIITNICLLYTSDAADERPRVDLGGRR